MSGKSKWLNWIIFIVLSLALSVIGSFANSLVNIALYYYATTQQVPPAFTAEMLNSVFIKRKRRFFKKDVPAA